MKCDRCDNEATVHEVVVRGGKKIEKHLCENCAREEGIHTGGQTPLSELLGKFVPQAAAKPATPPKKGGAASPGAACPTCSMTFAQFRQSGLLGCPDCYRAFEQQLGPLIERTHEGATHHAGKTPRRALAESEEDVLGRAEERARRMALLRKQLAAAVEAEQYERAAKLRDEISRALRPGKGGAATSPEADS